MKAERTLTMQQIQNLQQDKKTSNSGSLPICNNVMVHYLGENLHEISGEIDRWRDILAIPYQEALTPS
jgi:hypothetical protein